MTVPFLDLRRRIASREEEHDLRIAEVIEAGVFVGGPWVERFEDGFASYCGAAGAVGVASGTDALTLALTAAGVGRGDEVITPGNTCVPTVAAVEATGATPVLVDPDRSTRTLTADSVASALGPATRAIVPVHLYGHCADMPGILALGREHELIVVEDAAQAHGATLGGLRAGGFGDAAAFSFYPTKNLGGLGDGGAVVSTRQDILEGVRLLRNYGERERYLSVVSGRNSRLDTIQAAILSLRLEKLDEDNNRRRAIASYYLEALDRWGLSDHGVSLPQPVTESACPVYHLFVVTTEARETVRESLKKDGIESLVHYPRAIHQHPAYARLGRQPLPVSESLAESVFSIPLYPELSDAEVEHVAEAVSSALASACR